MEQQQKFYPVGIQTFSEIIGRRLFDAFIEEISVPEMTVNSSTYAVPFYKSLGFEQVQEPQITNGLKYVPMKREIK